MTFDDGFHPEMTSSEDFRAKFAALLHDRGIGLPELCRTVGVDPGTAQRAIEQGTYGLSANTQVLQRLLAFFRLDLSWLLLSPANFPKSRDERRFSLRQLVWQFVLADEDFPWMHRVPLVEYVVRIFDEKPAHSLQVAARTGLPRTVLDVGYIYERLLRQGYFDNAE